MSIRSTLVMPLAGAVAAAALIAGSSGSSSAVPAAGGSNVLPVCGSVPAGQARCIKGHKVTDGICTGAHLAKPKIGQHVTVTGPYVWDSFHGWNEIHPVWSIH